jgi:hypothetical protein
MKVLVYAEVPRKRLTNAKLNIPAGIDAARATGEYHERNIRSTNCCIDHELVLRINGNAIKKTDLYPFSLDQPLMIIITTLRNMELLFIEKMRILNNHILNQYSQALYWLERQPFNIL